MVLLIATIATLTFMAGCSPQIRVYSDADPEYDLKAYKTFDWGQKVNIENGKNPLHYNELNDKRIKSAILEQLKTRGYSLAGTDPDLIIHYHIIVDDQSVVVTEPFGYRYSPYWMQAQTNVYAYREGTLIVDIMDKKTNNLIWRGWATTAIDAVNPEKVDKLIKTAVKKIFKKFPDTQHRKNTSREIVSTDH